MIIAAAAPSSAQQSTRALADSPTIRLGYFANITHAQALLGFGEHLFARDLPGVTVNGTTFNAGPDEMNAIFAGAIDIGYIGPGPAINGFVRSHGAVVIVAGAAGGGTLLVARSAAHITSVKDLGGKTVSVPQLGNTQDILLRQLLHDNNLKAADHGGSVRIVAVQNADTLTLFQKGSLDAAIVPEPWGSRLLATSGTSLVLDWNQIYGGTAPATVVVASASFAKDHANLIVQFLRAHRKLTEQLQETRAQGDGGATATLLNAQIKSLTGASLAPTVLAEALARTTFTTTIDQPSLSQFLAFSTTAGYLRAGSSLAGLVDTWPLAHINDSSIH